jgi:hypothetical protein
MAAVSKPTFGCANCGKLAHKATRRVWNPYMTEATRKAAPEGALAAWDYTGNEIVIHRSKTDPGRYGSNSPAIVHWVSVWDGETWELAQGLFCRMLCAWEFAHDALRAGYRKGGMKS